MGSETDLLIIGAGAAGLAAARMAHASGIEHVVIEAASRIGGRAFTETGSLGTPFDHGAHYLHYASANPLRAYADEEGVSYDSNGYPLRLYDGGWLEDQRETRLAQFKVWLDALRDEADPANTRSSWNAAPAAARDDPLFVGYYEEFLGAPIRQSAAGEHRRYRDTYEDWPVRDGFGALIARFGREVQVTLDCRATRIDARGPMISVATTRGTIRARHVLVTVSTGVLAAGAIAFDPALPPEVEAAFGSLPMGYAGKIAFRLSEAPADPHQALVLSRGGLFANIVIGSFGRPTATLIVGGPDWEDIERAGSDEMIYIAREVVGEAYGARALENVRRVLTTRWLCDPFVLGGHSYAAAGGGDARAVLRTPVRDRIHFAGEATSADAWATVHGAVMTAEAAVERIETALQSKTTRSREEIA